MKKKKIRFLQYYYTSWMLLCLVPVVLFETDIWEEGAAAGNKGAESLWSGIWILLALSSIPLALKLPVSAFMKKRFGVSGELALKAYVRMSVGRITWLWVIFFQVVLGHYLFVSSTLFYLALMLLVALSFVWPSLKRMDADLGNTHEQDVPAKQ